jgi:hypothetical protein
MQDSQALNWSVEYLKEKCGDNIVHVRKNTNCMDYKVVSKLSHLQVGWAKVQHRADEVLQVG